MPGRRTSGDAPVPSVTRPATPSRNPTRPVGPLTPRPLAVTIGPMRAPDPPRDRLAELAFLEEVARLAASARTWDELMRTIIDRATAAAGTEVCSVYLVDRDGSGLTLAATNGLDPSAIGVARLPMGVGITGRVAAGGRPLTSLNVRRDRRFAWLAGVDEPRFTSMCSVPLRWGDAVVGVLNVQTVRRRAFSRSDVRFLETLAALLAGVVEKGRLQREAEAQLESLRAIDEVRARLVTIVTHELRTPLAVARSSIELAGREARRAGASEAERWELEALRQVDRIDSMIDEILAHLRVIREAPPALGPIDAAAVVRATVGSLAPVLRRHRFAVDLTDGSLEAVAAADPLRRVLEYLLENAAKYSPAGGSIRITGRRSGAHVSIAVTDDGPGVPAEWRERIFEPFVRGDDSERGSGIGLFAARHLARSMAGDLSVEAGPEGGSRFVLRLPAAVGPRDASSPGQPPPGAGLDGSASDVARVSGSRSGSSRR